MAQVEQKLASLGIVLPTPAAPIANYVGFVRTGSLLVISGQICLGPSGTLVAKGKLGETVTVEQGQSAARACAINLLAQVKIALGDLDKMVRVVRPGGRVALPLCFVNGGRYAIGGAKATGDVQRNADCCLAKVGLKARRPRLGAHRRILAHTHDSTICIFRSACARFACVAPPIKQMMA